VKWTLLRFAPIQLRRLFGHVSKRVLLEGKFLPDFDDEVSCVDPNFNQRIVVILDSHKIKHTREAYKIYILLIPSFRERSSLIASVTGFRSLPYSLRPLFSLQNSVRLCQLKVSRHRMPPEGFTERCLTNFGPPQKDLYDVTMSWPFNHTRLEKAGKSNIYILLSMIFPIECQFIDDFSLDLSRVFSPALPLVSFVCFSENTEPQKSLILVPSFAWRSKSCLGIYFAPRQKLRAEKQLESLMRSSSGHQRRPRCVSECPEICSL